MLILHATLLVAGLILSLATLPLTLELLALSLAAILRPRPVAPPAAGPGRPLATLAAIIPAHNEEKLIGQTVRSLLATPGAVPIVVAHNCTDATAGQARAAGAEVLVLNESSGKGKGAALHHGFTHALTAGFPAVLVVDADSVATPTLVPATLAALRDGAEATQARYLVANPTQTPRTRLLDLALHGMNVLRPRGRSRLGLSCGIFGNGFALSAETLRRVPYTAGSVVEDLEYHLLLVRAGIRVRFLDTATVLGEMPDNDAAARTQRARWEGGRLLMRRTHVPALARAVAAGHLRLAEPLLDLLSLPLATQAAYIVLLTLDAGLLLVLLRWHAAWPGSAAALDLLLGAYTLLALTAIVLYVAVSALLTPEPGQTVRALFAAPAYLLFKVSNRKHTRDAARRDAAWVRTDRNS